MMNLEPVETQYPIRVDTPGGGPVTVSRHRQAYQNIQLRLETIAGVEFVWVVICDCPEGFVVESGTRGSYGDWATIAARAWVNNWREVRGY